MKSITPIVSVILLVMITIVAAGGAFFFINSNVASLQSQGNLDTYPGMDNSKLNLVSITGSKAIVRNDGSSPVTDLVIFVNGELLNYSLSEPILPGELREINYNSRQSGDDLTIMMIYNDGKTETSTSPASINTPSSGFVEDPDPLNYVPSTSCLETSCSYPNTLFTGTIITTNYSSCACCGNDKFEDIFFNSTLLCSEGGIISDFDNSYSEDWYADLKDYSSAKSVCELNGKTWFNYSPNFTIPITHGSTSGYVWGLTVGDIDNDNDLDIISCDAGNYTYKWVNDGTGNFTGSSINTTDKKIENVQLGDLDNDGDLDFVTGDQGTHLYVWINDGSGNFTMIDSGTSGYGIYRSLTLFDYANDGDLDAIVGTSGSIEIFENNGSGILNPSTPIVESYGSEITSISSADLNNDGYIDIVTGDSYAEIGIWINNGSYSYEKVNPYMGAAGTIYDLALGDLDKDGDIDIISVDDSGYVYKWSNNGSATFTKTALENSLYTSINGVSLIDVDGDNDLDVIFVTQGGFYILINNGDGTFQTSLLIQEYGGFSIDIGDFTGSGSISVVLGTASSLQTSNNLGLSGTGGPCCEAGDTFTNGTHSCCSGVFQIGSC